MKATPRQDFPIRVVSVRREHDAEHEDLFVDMYFVTLNEEILLEVVPAVDLRTPWPPDLADVDSPASADEARRAAIWFARYAVTPNAQRAGEVDRTLATDGTVFFAAPAEFEALRAECEAIERDDARPLLSDLGDSALATFLRERFLPSGQLTEYALELLGGASKT